MQYLNWEMLWHIGAAVLGIGLVYGIISYYTRNRRNDHLTDDATRAQYDNDSVDSARAASANLKAQVRK